MTQPTAKTWELMQAFYVTFGPFPSKTTADAFKDSKIEKIQITKPHRQPTTVNPGLQAPRNKNQTCLCGVPVHTHKKPTLVLHLSNLCRLVDERGLRS